MKYLKLFPQHSDYQAFISGGGVELPNVSYCENENEVHYNPYIDPSNGHSYVDLGLPSGTKWATMNIGAERETDYGLYFAWGETQGYSGITNKKRFSWKDYKFGTESNITKYNATDGLTTLEASDDAATVNWGGNWKMPTLEQVSELCNTENCTHEWVKNYNGSGINGTLLTSVRNGNKLFVPAGGYYNDGSSPDASAFYGFMWANLLSPNDNTEAVYMGTDGVYNKIIYDISPRYIGMQVRPVFV